MRYEFDREIIQNAKNKLYVEIYRKNRRVDPTWLVWEILLVKTNFYIHENPQKWNFKLMGSSWHFDQIYA